MLSRRMTACFFLVILLSLALPCTAYAAASILRGYDEATLSYQYVVFGSYPTTEEGGVEPVLWRVLGPGVPGETDVINVEEANEFKRAGDKYPNEDVLTDENRDTYCLMTEYIIDFIQYHDVRDEADGPALDYADAMIRTTLNTEVINTLFTKEEQAVLVDMPQRGLLSVPSRKGELFRRDYGFIDEDFVKLKRRCTSGTPYAMSKGMRRIMGHSWYWTTDWRRYGSRWIVGDDGHISVSGLDRQGGVRPVCYIRADQLSVTGGDGTFENPYQLSVK